MLCLFTMLAIMPLADTGIFDYVAVWLLKKPFLKGHPWRLTISLFSLAFIGCICQGGIPILFMVFELTYKICDMCGMKRSHPWLAPSSPVLSSPLSLAAGYCPLLVCLCSCPVFFRYSTLPVAVSAVPPFSDRHGSRYPILLLFIHQTFACQHERSAKR